MSRMALRVAKTEDVKYVSPISQEKWSTNLRERVLFFRVFGFVGDLSEILKIRKLYKMGALRTVKMEDDEYPLGQYSFLSKRNGIRLAVLCNRCSNIYSVRNHQQLRFTWFAC